MRLFPNQYDGGSRACCKRCCRYEWATVTIMIITVDSFGQTPARHASQLRRVGVIISLRVAKVRYREVKQCAQVTRWQDGRDGSGSRVHTLNPGRAGTGFACTELSNWECGSSVFRTLRMDTGHSVIGCHFFLLIPWEQSPLYPVERSPVKSVPLGRSQLCGVIRGTCSLDTSCESPSWHYFGWSFRKSNPQISNKQQDSELRVEQLILCGLLCYWNFIF